MEIWKLMYYILCNVMIFLIVIIQLQELPEIIIGASCIVAALAFQVVAELLVYFVEKLP